MRWSFESELRLGCDLSDACAEVRGAVDFGGDGVQEPRGRLREARRRQADDPVREGAGMSPKILDLPDVADSRSVQFSVLD